MTKLLIWVNLNKIRICGLMGIKMPKSVSDMERARPISLSLTSEEIFVLEELLEKIGRAAPSEYRRAIKELGERYDITCFDQGTSKPTEAFYVFLSNKGWLS